MEGVCITVHLSNNRTCLSNLREHIWLSVLHSLLAEATSDIDSDRCEWEKEKREIKFVVMVGHILRQFSSIYTHYIHPYTLHAIHTQYRPLIHTREGDYGT